MAVSTGGIEPEKDEQQECKSPQRRAAIREERQWNTYDRTQPYNHSYVDTEMEDEITRDTIGIHTRECCWLTLGDSYYS